MDIQRLRNLTTGKLHTKMGDIYLDLEFLSGNKGVMTHMLPNACRAMEPWLRGKVTDPRFWDGKFDTTHVGEYPIDPMTEAEKKALFDRYQQLPHPFDKLASN